MLKALWVKLTGFRARRANRETFKNRLLALTSNGTLTTEDLDSLRDEYRSLGIDEADVAKVRAEVYSRMLHAVSADGSVSAKGEGELVKLERYLRIPSNEIPKSKLRLERLRLVDEIRHGNVPTAAVSGLAMLKSERAFWREPATLLEERIVSRRYLGGSAGVSVRVADGVSFRVGQSKGHVEAKTGVVPVSRGALIITNKRIVFQGDKKSVVVKLGEILNAEMKSNGLVVSGQAGVPHAFQFVTADNTEVIREILSYAISGVAEERID